MLRNKPKPKVREELTSTTRQAGASSLENTKLLLKYRQELRNNQEGVDFKYIEELVQNGANINERDSSGRTIVHDGCVDWDYEVMRRIIQGGI